MNRTIDRHLGTIPNSSGELQFENGMLTGGCFVLDLERMECTDLAGSDMHDVLIHHLQSDDFFGTERYPEAILDINSVETIDGKGPGERNLRLSGRLTMHGVTRQISFTAAAGITDAGKAAAQAAFAIDRTDWGIIYGSGKFFKKLAGHLVNDLIELEIRVVIV